MFTSVHKITVSCCWPRWVDTKLGSWGGGGLSIKTRSLSMQTKPYIIIIMKVNFWNLAFLKNFRPLESRTLKIWPLRIQVLIWQPLKRQNNQSSKCFVYFYGLLAASHKKFAQGLWTILKNPSISLTCHPLYVSLIGVAPPPATTTTKRQQHFGIDSTT